MKTVIQFLYYLCGVEVYEINYNPTGIKYNCMQKGLLVNLSMELLFKPMHSSHENQIDQG